MGINIALKQEKGKGRKHITYDIEEQGGNPQKLRMAENGYENKVSSENTETRRRVRENIKRAQIAENHRIWNKVELELRGKQSKEFPKTEQKKREL